VTEMSKAAHKDSPKFGGPTPKEQRRTSIPFPPTSTVHCPEHAVEAHCRVFVLSRPMIPPSSAPTVLHRFQTTDTSLKWFPYECGCCIQFALGSSQNGAPIHPNKVLAQVLLDGQAFLKLQPSTTQMIERILLSFSWWSGFRKPQGLLIPKVRWDFCIICLGCNGVSLLGCIPHRLKLSFS
jgi:hypothetical protein